MPRHLQGSPANSPAGRRRSWRTHQPAPPASLTDAQLTEKLQSLISIRDAVTAELRAVAGEWDKRLVWAGDGARSGAAWLARNTELSKGRAAAELRVAKRLGSMPAVAEASRSGALGAEKVAAVTHTIDRDNTGQLAGLSARDEGARRERQNLERRRLPCHGALLAPLR